MSRIYLVTQKSVTTTRLVRAANQAQAMHHVVKSDFDVSVATQDDLVNLIAAGSAVETAGAETQAAPAESQPSPQESHEPE